MEVGQVFDDVAFGPLNSGVPREEIEKRVDEALSMVGLSEMRERPTQQLSFGQRKRVSLAGALAMKPAVETPKDVPGWSIDPHGRRIFWIGGGARGILVWFERYSDGGGLIASNMPKGINSLSSGMHELVFDAIHVNGLQRFDEAVELIAAIKLIYTHPMGRSIAKAML